MILKRFLLYSKNTERSSYIWNMLGSMLMAFQSVIMLAILTHTVGLYEAGLFTIAYANANLFLNIGKYGMRNFQVSDVAEQFTFKEYKRSRSITTLGMIIVFLIYTLIVSHTNQYPSEKTAVILWMCVFKVIDSVEDVYHALYQQKDRLDIAGKALTCRMAITIVVFAAFLICLKSLLSALIITTIISGISFIIFTALINHNFKTASQICENSRVLQLIKTCFPLFLGCFLAFYIGNAPKYAIDSILNDELQACYGFISMPVFVIGLLNNFIFNPMIIRLSALWHNYEKKAFLLSMSKQILIIVIITAVCELGAYLIGIPVLSLLYNTDLSSYKNELLVLLLGGGFLALSGLLVTAITIIRRQKWLTLGYGVVSIIALFSASSLVRRYSIMGASLLYLFLMILLCVIFIAMLIIGLMPPQQQGELPHSTDS